MKIKLTSRTRFRMAGIRAFCFLIFFQLAAAVAWSQEPAATNAPPKFANSDCLDCHLDPNTTRTVNGKAESLVFPTNAFAHSVHAKLACVDCHTGVKDLV